MKTKYSTTFLLVLLSSLFLGCPNDAEHTTTECDDELKSINDELESISLIFGEDMINYDERSETEENCAIDKNYPVCYNTKTGTAYFTISIPKSMNFDKKSKNGQTLIYYFTGDFSDAALKYYYVTEGNLSRKPSDDLDVILCMTDMTYMQNDAVNTKKVDKHKKSVIQGVPFQGCKSDFVCFEMHTCE